MPSSQERLTETQQSDTNLLDFLTSDNYDLTTLLQDTTETEHYPTYLPVTSFLPTNTTTLSLPRNTVTRSLTTDTMAPSLPTDTMTPTDTTSTTTSNDTTYKPLPILNKLRNTQYRLRPTDTENLDSLDDVLERYISYVWKGEDGLLALVLAREAVFGAAVMAKCTPLGTKTKLALPQRELYTIKKAIFQCHPECWPEPQCFEDIWRKCHTAIQQGCGRSYRGEKEKQ